jgi:hypothetical protein
MSKIERPDSAPSADKPRDSINYLTFPFAITQRPDGGLPTVIMNEVKNSAGRRVGMFTTDPQNVDNLDGVTVIAADRPPMTAELFKLWFGTGYWSLLHPKAHTRDAVTPEALRAMYPQKVVAPYIEAAERAGQKVSTDIGSHDFLHQYVAAHAPSIQVSRNLNDSFAAPIQREIARAHLNEEIIRFNFQDYFFHPVVEKFAPVIREKNGFTSLHLHTTLPMIPEHLPVPEMIVQLARAASKVDVVLTHTEAYNERLRRIMERLSIQPPSFRTFALGIDEADMLQREGRITRENYVSSIPDLDKLSDRQRTLIKACFDAERAGIPHQFGVYDRLDPIKGVDTVFTAIDEFLTQEHKTLSMQELQQRYRFFNLLSQFVDLTAVNPTNMAQAYSEHVARLGMQLEAKWPGIFVMSEGLGGKHRDLLVALMRGRTVITGGAEDGLNQVVMESSFINRDLPTAIISGRNIGFVMEVASAGMLDNIFAFESGHVSQLADRIRDVAIYQAKNPSHLVNQKTELNRLIERRTASMLIDE